MVGLIKIAVQLLGDAARFAILLFRPTQSVQAENLFLRRQLALFKERGVQPRRIDAATRISLALLARLFQWRDALFVVRPQTMIRWHRAGWRLFWRWKCRPGRPRIPIELRALIRRMARENPVWGEERIAYELLVKLGIQVSPRTVRKYMQKWQGGQPRGDQRWSTFLKNHAKVAPRARRVDREIHWKCVNAKQMRVGPSESACRRRLQTASSCCGRKVHGGER